jgi:hypothetical protein
MARELIRLVVCMCASAMFTTAAMPILNAASAKTLPAPQKAIPTPLCAYGSTPPHLNGPEYIILVCKYSLQERPTLNLSGGALLESFWTGEKR